MGHIQGQARDQITLFPDCIDDYITPENPVRVINAFVDGLSIEALGFTHATPADTGRPPYDPGDLLKLYVYGYLNRVRSSRMLEREAQRNLELVWLLRRLVPDFKTIADFRRDNGRAIQQTCRDFILLCKRLSLFGAELIAIDGSKFKAVNNKDRNFTKARLKRRLAHIDAQIVRYLKALDEHDRDDAAHTPPTGEEMQALLKTLRQRRAHYQGLLGQLSDSDEKQISLTDADARYMGHAGIVGDNVQTAVDDKHKLICTFDVTNENPDTHQLSPMAKQAKHVLGVKTLDVVADKGYYCGVQVKTCVEAGITSYIPKFATSNSAKRGLFGKQHFRYDPGEDCYWCPAGEKLEHRYPVTKNGLPAILYETTACGTCVLRPHCTRTVRRPRRLTRWVHEALMDAMAARVKRRPDVMRKRRAIVEHPFGTIKRTMQQGEFLMKGLPKVCTEMSLTVLAYNLKRAINILGPRAIIDAVG